MSWNWSTDERFGSCCFIYHENVCKGVANTDLYKDIHTSLVRNSEVKINHKIVGLDGQQLLARQKEEEEHSTQVEQTLPFLTGKVPTSRWFYRPYLPSKSDSQED